MQCDDGPRPPSTSASDDASPGVVSGALRGLEQAGSADRPAVLLVVDDYVTMRVWDETVARLADELARQESLGPITRLRLLSSDDTEPGRIRLEHLPRPWVNTGWCWC